MSSLMQQGGERTPERAQRGMVDALGGNVFHTHEIAARQVVAVVGGDAEALDELHRYLWCCGALTRSSTRLAHAARLPPRGGVLVLFVDDFSVADVVATLREAHALELVTAILVTAHASTFRELQADAEIGAMLLILDAPAQVWTLLDTVRACFDCRNAPAA